MMKFFVLSFLLLQCSGSLLSLQEVTHEDALFQDQVNFWLSFRDETTGLYCDSLYFNDNQGCGESNNRYSSASTGMGLIMDAVLVELNMMNKSMAETRAEQTFQSLSDLWPKEAYHGFYVHWTDRSGEIQGEFSTIDSALLALGGLFSANYFKENEILQSSARSLALSVKWSDALEAYDSPIIYPVANESTGEMTGVIRPYNEYYLVAYLAKMFNDNDDDDRKASKYFETYFGTENKPVGDGTYPVDREYFNYPLLTDNSLTFMSSFIPQFCWYQAKGYHTNDYYFSELFPNWLYADMLYWDNVRANASLIGSPLDELWGIHIDNSNHSFFGCGAGDSPTGYSVNRIDNSQDFVFSAAIMAGFLPALNGGVSSTQQIQATDTLKNSIVNDLNWLYDNVGYDTGLGYKVVWRYSLNQSDWHASLADSIDYVTMVLGLSTLYLPTDFFETYAA